MGFLRVARLPLLSALLLLWSGPAWAGQSMPSVLAFPLGAFPGQGVCQGYVSDDTASSLGLNGAPHSGHCRVERFQSA